MANPEWHDDDDCCPECCGEGVVYNCFEEYACADPESGCDLCMKRCPLCAPVKKDPHHG